MQNMVLPEKQRLEGFEQQASVLFYLPLPPGHAWIGLESYQAEKKDQGVLSLP